MTAKKTAPPSESKRSIRSRALNTLAEWYPDQFHGLMEKGYADAGLTYERPLTEEEKAKATIAELVAKFPSLGGRVAAVVPTPMAAGDDDDSEFARDIGVIDPALSRSKP